MKPRTMTVEIRTEPSIHTRFSLIGLMNVKMQHIMVDALGPCPVSQQFQISRRLPECKTGSKSLRRDEVLTVSMCGRGSSSALHRIGALFTIRQPKFSADLMAGSAVIEKLTGKSPMAVIFQPKR